MQTIKQLSLLKIGGIKEQADALSAKPYSLKAYKDRDL